VLSEIYYKKQPLDIGRFRSLVLEKGFDPNKPIGSKALRRAGLSQPMDLLSGAISQGTHEKVIEAAGFTTYRSTTFQNDEQRLNTAVLEYHHSKAKPINVKAMIHDVEGGGSRLASALGRLAKKKFGKRTTSLALEYLGFKIVKPHHKDAELRQKLQAFWPKDTVQAAYEGHGSIATTGHLNILNNSLYKAVVTRGPEFVNSLYPDFPDLWSYVFSRDRNADPETLRNQLLQRFHSGLSISRGLRESPELSERLLYKRVISLQPQFFGTKVQAKTYSQIVHELLPEMSLDEIKGNSSATIRRNGAIGNLFLEWILRWTLKIDNTGAFYKDGFRRVFAAPLQEIHAETRIGNEDEFSRPDFLVVGQKNSAVEVKTGEHIYNPTTLRSKYNPDADYSWKINDTEYPLERLVAVLHMPPKIFKKAAPRLVDASYEVAGAEQFLGWLETFIAKLGESPWHKQLYDAAPRLHNPDTLIDFYKQLALKPATMTRPTSTEMASFAKETLERLVACEPAA